VSPRLCVKANLLRLYNKCTPSHPRQIAGQEIEKHIAGLGNVNCLDALVPILTMRYAPLDLNLDVSLENR